MSELIDELLTLAREYDADLDPEPVDLGAAVRACWDTLDADDATVEVRADDRIRADPTRLERLLENLLRNSVEHGALSDPPPSDDAVERSSTSPRSEDREDAAAHGPADNRMVPDGDGLTVTVGELPDGFYVADDGPGIPAEERDSVFEYGYSTAAEGTGLGLAIVEQCADLHDWEVRATEAETGGARFEITGVEAVDGDADADADAGTDAGSA